MKTEKFILYKFEVTDESTFGDFSKMMRDANDEICEASRVTDNLKKKFYKQGYLFLKDVLEAFNQSITKESLSDGWLNTPPKITPAFYVLPVSNQLVIALICEYEENIAEEYFNRMKFVRERITDDKGI